MKLIKPKAELLLQQPGLEGVYKQIELAGRTCYKSTDKITEDSAKPFVDRMINSNHLAMLEHGTVYLTIPGESEPDEWGRVLPHTGKGSYTYNKYSKVNWENWWQEPVGTQKEFCNAIPRSNMHITTNLRVLVENNWLDDLKYICEPTEHHEKRYTFRLTTSIGVTRELNRHRVHSIAEQSTRYCNYSKDKFGKEVTFCIPSWINIPEGNAYWADGLNYRIQPNDLSKESYAVKPNKYFTTEEAMTYSLWLHSLEVSENNYMKLLKLGWQPQHAREILSLCTATEIIHTAFASDWKHFFDLRYYGTTGKPHPNMVELSTLMKEEAEKYGIWNDIHNIEFERIKSDKNV